MLHSEPGDVFFCIPEADPGLIELTAVEGQISGERGLRFRSVTQAHRNGTIPETFATHSRSGARLIGR